MTERAGSITSRKADLARLCAGRSVKLAAAAGLFMALALALSPISSGQGLSVWSAALAVSSIMLLLACHTVGARAAPGFESTRLESIESIVHEGTRNYRRVRLTLFGVLITLCCNFAIQNWHAVHTERSRRVENEAIELAATQRWLSQRIARLALSPSLLTDPAAARELRAAVAQSDAQAARLRELLIAQGLLSDDEHADLGPAWRAWVARRVEMAVSAKALADGAELNAAAIDAGHTVAVGARADEALTRVQELLDAMHASSARSHAARVRQMQLWAGLNIVLLSVLALAAVVPAMRSIRRQYRRLSAQALDLQHLALVAERTTNAVLLIDEQRRISWVNQAFTRITGLMPAEAIGRDALAVLLPTGSEGEATVLLHRSLASTHAGGRVQICRRDAQGPAVWLDLDIQPLFDDAGSPRGHVAVSVDITQLKLAQSDLRIAAIAFDSSGGIAVTDEDKRILRVNAAFTRITGFSIDEARGRTMGELLRSGRHEHGFYQAMDAALERDRHWQGEIWKRRKSGEVYPQWMSITAVPNEQGRTTNYVAVFTDITEKKRADETIHALAFFDPLTKLPNRRLLRDRIEAAIAGSAHSGRHAALLFIDLDNFKELNDSKGHEVGDQLLCAVSARLSAGLRSDDTVARLGGDEFVVILAGLSTDTASATAQAERLAETIRSELNRAFVLGSLRHHTSPSIGISVFVGAALSVDELLMRADSAMYQAKHAGRNAYRFFDPVLHAEREQRIELEADLRRALELQQLELHFQPQVDADGVVIGAEALLRWKHVSRGNIPPGVFIPLAEESDLIVDIGTWVLGTAARQLAAWSERADWPPLRLSVNVSARQFRKADFCDTVLEITQRIGPRANLLELELTESLILVDVDEVVSTMHGLRALGVRLALDDFGTGQSSLSYLTRLPLDQLKIDQSFIRNLTQSRSDDVVVQTIIGLAQKLNIDVIAEGVETEEQRGRLIAMGCLRQQGYLFGKPMPLPAFEAFVHAHAAG